MILGFQSFGSLLQDFVDNISAINPAKITYNPITKIWHFLCQYTPSSPGEEKKKLVNGTWEFIGGVLRSESDKSDLLLKPRNSGEQIGGLNGRFWVGYPPLKQGITRWSKALAGNKMFRQNVQTFWKNEQNAYISSKGRKFH